MTTPNITPLDGYRLNVGLLIINAAGEVLMGERRDFPGAWQMPQGGIDEGETPQQAALRELTEETGLLPASVTIIDEYPRWLIYVLPAHFGVHNRAATIGQMQRWFVLRYHGEGLPTPPQVGEIEFSQFKWVPLANITPDVIYFRQSIYEELAAYFGPRWGQSQK